MDWFLERARALGVEHRPPAPILLGRHLLALGLKPGPRVGEILKAVYEQQMDGTVTSTRRSDHSREARTEPRPLTTCVSETRPLTDRLPTLNPEPEASACTIRPMARYTLVYGVRLIPEGTLKGVDEATLKLADGSTAGLTLHTFDGTIPQLRRSLDRSLDAFFDLLPGADDEDVETFGD